MKKENNRGKGGEDRGKEGTRRKGSTGRKAAGAQAANRGNNAGAQPAEIEKENGSRVRAAEDGKRSDSGRKKRPADAGRNAERRPAAETAGKSGKTGRKETERPRSAGTAGAEEGRKQKAGTGGRREAETSRKAGTAGETETLLSRTGRNTDKKKPGTTEKNRPISGSPVQNRQQGKGTKQKKRIVPPSGRPASPKGTAGASKSQSGKRYQLSSAQKTLWERLEDAGEQISRTSKKINKKRVRMMAVWGMEIAAACLLAFTLVFFYGQRVSNAGDSMSPVLKNGDVVLVDRVIYNATKPKRGDVIVFKPNGNQNAHYMIKRVAALPGETIQIRDGAVYIDGKECTEGIYAKDILSPGIADEPVELGENEYFVIGDNHAGSDDSRMADVGNVKREDIFGKAWFIVNFGEDFGFIKK